jgi:molybdenum-dependent DNA-binding transcriptional regulator ModE
VKHLKYKKWCAGGGGGGGGGEMTQQGEALVAKIRILSPEPS